MEYSGKMKILEESLRREVKILEESLRSEVNQVILQMRGKVSYSCCPGIVVLIHMQLEAIVTEISLINLNAHY